MSAQPRQYRGVMFDLGGTLFYDLPGSLVSSVQMRVLSRAGVSAQALVGAEAVFRQARLAVEAELRAAGPYLHRDLVTRHFLAGAHGLGVTPMLEDPKQAADDYCALMRETVVNSLRLQRDCHETLAALGALGCDLTVVSNNDEDYLQALIARWGLDRRLRHWLSSDRAGICKPDPAIFALGLAGADIDLGEVLYVGDSVADDVDGALAAGMDVALLVGDKSPAGADRATYRISGLADLVGIVSPQ